MCFHGWLFYHGRGGGFTHFISHSIFVFCLLLSWYKHGNILGSEFVHLLWTRWTNCVHIPKTTKPRGNRFHTNLVLSWLCSSHDRQGRNLSISVRSQQSYHPSTIKTKNISNTFNPGGSPCVGPGIEEVHCIPGRNEYGRLWSSVPYPPTHPHVGRAELMGGGGGVEAA